MGVRGLCLGELSTAGVIDGGISLVPEGRAIFPDLTVRENLELGAWNHRNVRFIEESIEDVVKLFPRIGERMDVVRHTGGFAPHHDDIIGPEGEIPIGGRPLRGGQDQPPTGAAAGCVEGREADMAHKIELRQIIEPRAA